MSNNFSKTIWLVLVGALVFTGCKRQYEEQVVETLDSGPNIEMTAAPPDYVVKAIEAVGGWDVWVKSRELNLDCVVTFYQPDGSYHLTEQHHVVYPWSNSIQISAREPEGRFVWELSRGKFNVLQGNGQSNALPVVIGSKHFAEMILSIITIPARFFDEAAGFSKETTGIKIQGQWYYPIARSNRPVIRTETESEPKEPVVPLSKAVFYQDRDNSIIDMLLFDYMGDDNILAVRGYDYTRVENNGVLVPARIEMFKADANGNLQQRLVKIDNHTIHSK